MSPVEVSISGTTTVVTIDRPEVRNAVDQSTADALVDAFSDFEDDDDQHVAVLTGSSGTFCSGADLKAISAGRGNRITQGGNGPMGPTRLLLSKPVVAAVEGHAVAGGLELALWCDLRVAARDAVFGVFCRRWGVPLVDGGTIRLPRLIGHSRAMDLILTGRPVTGEEAVAIGLANRLAEPGEALQAAVGLAEEIGAFPQLCLRADRISSYQQWDLEMPEAIANESRLGTEVIRSGESAEGAGRFAAGEGRHGGFPG